MTRAGAWRMQEKVTAMGRRIVALDRLAEGARGERKVRLQARRDRMREDRSMLMVELWKLRRARYEATQD